MSHCITNERQVTQPGSRSPTPGDMHPDGTIIAGLQNAAKTSSRVCFYSPGQTDCPTFVSYRDLYQMASHSAGKLQALSDWKPGKISLVCLDDHRSNILAFWSILLAGGIPAMTAPFPSGDASSKIRHLCQLLSNPLCLTTEARRTSEFAAFPELTTISFASLEFQESGSCEHTSTNTCIASPSATAVLMLTSGSSGNSKAVPLSHDQLISCVRGKIDAFPCDPGETILNWISMDHVAGLVECHLRALFGCADQIHAEPADVVSNPSIFLELLARHKVAVSFAPNFLLARILDGFERGDICPSKILDLSHLRCITSGGEACTTATCHRFTQWLQKHGTSDNVVVPGFGMTETGAGCIYSFSCPRFDLEENYEFTSVGKCIRGVELRISPLNATESDDMITFMSTNSNKSGNVEIRGPNVFGGYFNNPEANLASFTPDKWFRTGDMGFVDHHGNLVLTGRTSEVMCINGLKHVPTEQERIIEDLRIPGVTPDYVACFPWRPAGLSTERCVIVYQHLYAANDKTARAEAHGLISKAVLLNIGCRPEILPLPPSILQKSSLGKLSRSKIRKQFEQGEFAEQMSLNAAMMLEATTAAVVKPVNDTEITILNIVASTLQLDPQTLSVETSFYNAGLTSINLIRIRSKICQAFNQPSFSIKHIITQNTVRKLAQTILADSSEPSKYQPVVQLKSSGSKTPLWLIHPGVGEVLVFVGLTQHIQGRPVYALRARGFEDGEEPFRSIDEAVATYVDAIRAHQPHGPYAIAGYSYGSMLAFEITKRLETRDETIAFLGCFNLPPHIKIRMRQMTLQSCLTHLAQFLGLITENQAGEQEMQISGLSVDDAITRILATADQARWQELDVTREGLARWAQVAFSLQSLAIDYEPSGTVSSMDVFWCDPLAVAARSKKEWREVHLAKWTDFCRSEPVFHAVEGAHYTMLSPSHVRTFQKTLADALSSRGV